MAAGPRARGARGRRQWTGARASGVSAGRSADSLPSAPRPRGGGRPQSQPRSRGSTRRSALPAVRPDCRRSRSRAARPLRARGLATWGRERWAGNVYWTGLGAPGGPGGGPSHDFCHRGGPRLGRKPRWVWSARAGEKLQCDQSHQAPPERPARHGHPVALLPKPSRATPSPLFSQSGGPLAPTLARPSPTVALEGTFRDLLAAEASLSPVLPAAPQPLARGRQAGCRELAAPSRKLQSICNALSLIGSSELNFNKAFVSSRLIVKTSIRPGR